MKTLLEAIEEIERLNKSMALRDKLILKLTDRLDSLEKSRGYLMSRPPIRKLPYPKALRDIGIVPPDKRGKKRSATR